MTRGALAAALLLAAAGAAGPLPAAPPEISAAPATFREAVSDPAAMRALAGAMSDDELLGQVFMLGYPGAAVPPELRRWIEQRGLGGVKLFPRNAASLNQLAATTAALQEAARRQPRQIPLLIATDQEGGWIRHVKHAASQTPGNLALGAAGLPADAFHTGRYLGAELAALGINMNFAPTVDVYSDPAAAVIGPRAFSSDPVQTGLLAVAFFRGLQSAGVMATAKHFPGHGAADRDSHLVLPRVSADLDQLWQRELVPYRFLIREGVPAIMTGHLAFPEVTGEHESASLSPWFVGTLLRERLGFNGIVLTDDLEMDGAVEAAGSPAQAALAALRAGTDLVMIAHTPDWQRRAWELARRRMRADADFRRQIREAAHRVLEGKRAALSAAPPAPLGPAGAPLEELVPAPGAAEFFFAAAARAVTVLRGGGLPLAEERGRMLLVGQHQAFIDAGRRRYPGADAAAMPYTPFYSAREPHLSRIPALARGYDTVIYELANYNSLEILQRLEPLAARLIVVSALTPVYLRQVPWVRTAIAVYGTSAASFEAGFGVLAGDYRATGRLPLDFAGIAQPAPGAPATAASAPGAGAP